MSFSAAVEKLDSPVKDLVVSVTKNGSQYVGESEEDKAEVATWIEKAGEPSLVAQGNLNNLDISLISRTYIATNYFTAADVALYGALHPIVSRLQPSQYYSHPSVTRYFDHIQSEPSVKESAGSRFSPVVFDLENAPAIERKAEPVKVKEKRPSQIPAQEIVPPPNAEAATARTEGAPLNTQKKEKKENKKKGGDVEGSKKSGGGKVAPAAEDAGEPIPSMIDLRVGHIVDVIKHPDADGLYVEQIDLGEETGPRTVVSGLVNYIPIEQMRDKYLVAVCNLKPANMRGVKSFAMVLCGTSKEGKEGGIELIQPPPGSKPGERVYFEGEEYENGTPLSQLNPKKKIFETIQPGFITLDTREAAWINPTTKNVHKIRTKDGVCMAPTLIGASLS
ncbi:hypothetical protein BDQ17DRAFT_1232028 [Cyathus striatus]|nr:hypothetical protein BDQ17DRAFT_1232028 [Cyathus striatus]